MRNLMIKIIYTDRNGCMYHQILKSYVEYVEVWYEYDDHHNIIHMKCSDGLECNYNIQYYEDGQLKKLDNILEIPWFEK